MHADGDAELRAGAAESEESEGDDALGARAAQSNAEMPDTMEA